MQNGSDVNTTMSNSTYDVIRSTVATISAAGNETKSVAKAYVADPVTEFWEYVSVLIKYHLPISTVHSYLYACKHF